MPEEIGSSEAGRKWLPGFAENVQAQAPDRAAALCLALAFGAADVLSGRYVSVRDNLTALKSSAEERSLVKRYTAELNTQEDTLAALRRDLAGLQQQRQSAEAHLSNKIETLTLEEKIGSQKG